MAKFTFTDPEGRKHTRNSKTRNYTHAILYREKEGRPYKLGSCVGRPELLAYRLEYWGRGSPDVVAVAVDKVEAA